MNEKEQMGFFSGQLSDCKDWSLPVGSRKFDPRVELKWKKRYAQCPAQKGLISRWNPKRRRGDGVKQMWAAGRRGKIPGEMRKPA